MRRAALMLAGAAALIGCGGGETTTGPGGAASTSSGGEGGRGGGASSGTESTSTTTSTTSSAGTSAGGAGSGGAAGCVPGSVASCYSGPFGTEGVGDCKAGTKTCKADGSDYEACTGDVTPQPETCVTAGDEDCNGLANEAGEGCVCVPGSVKLCYSGPAGTAGVGACIEGVLTCLPAGTGYGPCEGEVVPKAEVCATADDEDCDGKTPLCPALWARTFGNATPQFVWGLAVDPTGAVTVTGELQGTADFGGGVLTSAGTSDIFLARYDAAGAHVFSKRFGDAAIQAAQGVATAANGDSVITGYFQGTVNFGGAALTTAGLADIFVARFDSTGKHLWSKKFGSTVDDQLGLAVAFDSAGDVLLTGSFLGTITFGVAANNLVSAGASDIFVAKLAGADGAHVWSKRFGDVGLTQEGRGIAADAAKNVIVTGGFDGTVNFGGAALTSAGDSDVFVAKLAAADGAHVFSARYGDAGYQKGRGVGVDAAGNIVVVGDFAGSVDFGGGALPNAGATDGFAVQLDPMGAHLYSTSFGGAGYDSATAVAVAGSAVALTGYFDGTAKFGATTLVGGGGRDIFAVRLADANLGVVSARSFGDSAFYQSGQAVGLDGTGNLLLGGFFAGSVDFGLGPSVSAGQTDGFVAKFAP